MISLNRFLITSLAVFFITACNNDNSWTSSNIPVSRASMSYFDGEEGVIELSNTDNPCTKQNMRFDDVLIAYKKLYSCTDMNDSSRWIMTPKSQWKLPGETRLAGAHDNYIVTGSLKVYSIDGQYIKSFGEGDIFAQIAVYSHERDSLFFVSRDSLIEIDKKGIKRPLFSLNDSYFSDSNIEYIAVGKKSIGLIHSCCSRGLRKFKLETFNFATDVWVQHGILIDECICTNFNIRFADDGELLDIFYSNPKKKSVTLVTQI